MRRDIVFFLLESGVWVVGAGEGKQKTHPLVPWVGPDLRDAILYRLDSLRLTLTGPQQQQPQQQHRVRFELEAVSVIARKSLTAAGGKAVLR
jgi:hypothetical protein